MEALRARLDEEADEAKLLVEELRAREAMASGC